MKLQSSFIIILLAAILSPVYGEKMIAQPESREIYYNGTSYSSVATANPDPNFAYLGFHDPTTDHNNGALVLAFKLPSVPAGQMITQATVHWYYAKAYKYYRVKHDLYVLASRPASANPAVVAQADYLSDYHDPNNAMLLQRNIADDTDVTANKTFDEWRHSSLSSDSLALFLQNQCFNAGAQANDWVFIRFNQQANSPGYCREEIRGPGYFDPNYRPYIEYTLGPARERMVAQPQSREIFSDGFDHYVLETSKYDPITGVQDVNIMRMSRTDMDAATQPSFNLVDGALALAFKLPQLPAGKVIAGAALKWYYEGYYDIRPLNMDLYGIPRRAASTSPLITSPADHYWGTNDTDDAVMIQKDIAHVSVIDAPGSTEYINRWVSSNVTAGSHAMAKFLQDQYNAGANVNDWILLRFSPQTSPLTNIRHDIRGVQYFDLNYRPYIEYQLADSSYGYWKAITMEPQVCISQNGVYATRTMDTGCFELADANNPGMLSVLVPFKFPQLASNEYIAEADLSAVWGGRTVSFQDDLYGLPHRSSPTFVPTDFWIGPYAPQAGDVPNVNCGTPLQSDIFAGFPTTAGAAWVADANGAARTACYLNALKAAGATSNSYGFLRINPRYDFDKYARQSVSSFTMWVRVATVQPTCLPAPVTEAACPGFNNPNRLIADTDGDCKVTFADLAIMASKWATCSATPISYCN